MVSIRTSKTDAGFVAKVPSCLAFCDGICMFKVKSPSSGNTQAIRAAETMFWKSASPTAIQCFWGGNGSNQCPEYQDG
jgi:hypothetical protein